MSNIKWLHESDGEWRQNTTMRNPATVLSAFPVMVSSQSEKENQDQVVDDVSVPIW